MVKNGLEKDKNSLKWVRNGKNGFEVAIGALKQDRNGKK